MGDLNSIWYDDLTKFKGPLFRCVLHDTINVELYIVGMLSNLHNVFVLCC